MLVRALEISPKLVVRGRVELPTFRFSGWQTTTSDPTGSIQRVTLAFRLGGPADSGAHPIMSATGVEGGEKLCERAIPAVSRAVGRGRGDHLPRLLVLAANQRDGRMRASFGQDPVGLVLIRSDVSSTHVNGVGPAPCAFQRREQAHESDRP
jgi:hypothetical protein